MPTVYRYLGDVFEERRKDTFILQAFCQDDDIFLRDPELALKRATDWLDDRGVHWEMVGYTGEIEGDFGHRYVAFEDWDDPILAEWCKEFETADGGSIYPEFQLYGCTWEGWVEHHQADFLQYKTDIEDPDYEW